MIEEATVEAVELVRAFSEFVQMPSAAECVDLMDLIRSVVESRIPEAQGRNIRLSIRVGDVEPQSILFGDRVYLESALASIVDGMIDGILEGGEITAELSWSENDLCPITRLVLKIAAHAFKFTVDEVKSMLDPFRDKRSKSSSVSVGLASRYLELHGGLMSIRSTTPNSVECTVELPVGQPMNTAV
jgi:nitrogen fixation/metabolism regulation signal transduction histidine kinase